LDVNGRIQARRAIEALRAGVPNRDAVIALGCAHPEIEEVFRAQLSDAREYGPDAIERGPVGFLVAGNFGTGKSHLLEYLQQIALEQEFVVSKVIISKETPLYDPVKVYRAAVSAAVAPGRVGAALTQIAGELKFDSPAYQDFSRWIHGPTAGLNQRFAATTYLFEHARQDPELRDRIVAFWGGDPIQIGEIKSAFRELGQRVTYAFERVGVRQLAYERFRFVPRLMMAAGFAGWVVLFDEVDLIARYTLMQRGKSYAEIARWTGQVREETFPGIVPVLAITSAFEAEVIDGRNDREAVPGKLLQSTREPERLLAGQAEKGMRQIGRALRLGGPSRETIDQTHETVRTLHGRAFGWDPPAATTAGERLASTRMREYVRTWINEWDLRRLDPTYDPQIEITAVAPSYAEDTEFQRESAGEDAERGEERRGVDGV
jgi:hypothetical protein